MNRTFRVTGWVKGCAFGALRIFAPVLRRGYVEAIVKNPEPFSGDVLDPLAETPAPTEWPPQVDLVMSALEAGKFARGDRDRRKARRKILRVTAWLRLFIDGPATPPWTLYSRDVHARGMGFITAHRLPLGYGGLLELPSPNGTWVSVACTLLRCREAAPGWFDGALYFNRDQPAFEA